MNPSEPSATAGDAGPFDRSQMPARRLVARRVVAALARLDSVERDAVVLAAYDDTTYHDVASDLGIPIAWAAARIRSGLRSMYIDLADISPGKIGGYGHADGQTPTRESPVDP